MNTAVLLLRAYQMGMKLEDLNFLNLGDVIDIFIELSNDGYDYPYEATQSDMDEFARG